MKRSALGERGGKGGGEQRLFVGGDGAEVEEEAVVFDAGDDWGAALGFAEALFELGGGMAGACDGDEMGGQLLIGSGAAADYGEARQDLDGRVARECRAQMSRKVGGAPVDFVNGRADHAQGGDFV